MDELRLEALEPELLLDDVLVEAAGVLVEVEVLDLDDAGDHGVEEGPVVRDDDRCAAERAEPGFEPLDARDVEEVRRLVEEQDVRALEEDLRERRAVAPTPGERVDGEHAARGVEAERGEGGVDVALVVPAVLALHLLEELGLPFDELRHPVQVVRVGGDRGVDGCEFRLDGVDVTEESFEDLGDGGATVELRELREVPDPRPVLDGHRARVRLELVERELQEGGLA
ncbi:hypothetical protein ABIC64_003436 [Plantibacter flavus]